MRREQRDRSKIENKNVKVRIFVATLTVIGVSGAVLLTAPKMAPVEDGTSAEFWSFACGIDWHGERRAMGGVYPSREGWFIYYRSGLHGQFLYRVPSASAIEDFPELIRDIEKSVNSGEGPCDLVQAYWAWKERDTGTAEDFLASLRDLDLKDREPKSYQYRLKVEEVFDQRWERAKRFWMNILFEIVILSGLAIFLLWPWIRRSPIWRWAVHAGLFLPLLFLPFFLGYCPLTFTSAWRWGGALYPWLIIHFRGLSWTDLDWDALKALPKPLEGLSQTSGPALSISGMGAVGPTTVVLIGALVAGAILASSWAIRMAREAKK